MSEPGCIEEVPSLAALREAGAQRLDPMRFRYLEVLSRRLEETMQGEVRALVQERLQQALADYAARFQRAQQAAVADQGMQRSAAPAPAAAVRPLVQLSRYLQERTQDAGDGRPCDSEFDAQFDTAFGGEMKSVRRFRQAWSRIAAEDQVELAAGRGPVNAGPLNSHMLVLRSLELMRGLSPDYLQHFLSQVDSLLWLEQAHHNASPGTRPARRNGLRKSEPVTKGCRNR